MDLEGRALFCLHQIDSVSRASPEKHNKPIFIIEIHSCAYGD